MKLRTVILFALAGALAGTARAASTSLLQEAVDNWLGERDHWAFTQRAVEFDGDQRRERLERYDPSKAGNARWTLLAINGKTPTAEQREAWARKKFRRNHRRVDTPLGDFFEFDDARLISESGKLVRYSVPLRRDKNWLFQTDKVNVVVTVNKETRALDHLSADVREPMKVLLGLAKVTEGKVDLSFFHDDDDASPGPESAKPTGTARVTVSKFGERAEFTWSDFKRVTPLDATAATEPKSYAPAAH